MIGILVVAFANLVYQIYKRKRNSQDILKNIPYIAMELFTNFADSFNEYLFYKVVDMTRAYCLPDIGICR